LLPGYASTEVQNYQDSLTWQQIAHNPLDLPYKTAILLLSVLGYHHLVAARAVAASFGVLTVVIFFCIARAWYGLRVGFMGTVLFATSAGFLHLARLGSPQILQMGILALFGVLLWHRRSPRGHPYLTYLVALTFGLLCYVPGMIWFELLAIGLMYRRGLHHWQESTVLQRIIVTAIPLILIAPLAVATVMRPGLAFSLLGLPNSLHNLTYFGGHLLDAVLSIGVRSDGSSLLWVGHSPLLNAVELVLAALGIYYYVYQKRSLRSLLLCLGLVMSLVLVGLHSGVGIATVVPLLYLLITCGLNHFLNEWLTVFPRNPIARVTGIVVICLMLFFSAFYQMRSYFVAWPHNTETHQRFQYPPS